MRIRRYIAADHDAVWELHNSALLKADAHGGNGPWDDDLHRVEDEYIATGGEFYVGTVGGRIVAMGGLQRLSDDRAELRRMRVHPDLQRRGLGGRMLSALEQRATELGYRTLTLDTTVQQVPAIRLYTRSGYRETGGAVRKVQDTGVREEDRVVVGLSSSFIKTLPTEEAGLPRRE